MINRVKHRPFVSNGIPCDCGGVHSPEEAESLNSMSSHDDLVRFNGQHGPIYVDPSTIRAWFPTVDGEDNVVGSMLLLDIASGSQLWVKHTPDEVFEALSGVKL